MSTETKYYEWVKAMVDGVLNIPNEIVNHHWKNDFNDAPLFPEKVNRAIRKNYHSELENISWLRPVNLSDIIREAAGKDGWVSVEDGLPEEDSAVLCYDKYHNQIRVLCWNKYHHVWDDESGDDYYTDAVGGKVTHWQPLPQPPVK